MRIDLSCPAEILRLELPKKEEPWVKLLLMNEADRGINSCEATIKILDAKGQELGRAVHRARALTGRPHSTFWMSVPMDPLDGAAFAEGRLDKVWFEDNDVWRRNEAAEVEYEDNALPAGNELNALKFAAGSSAVGFPSQQARLWVCVCGRANSNHAYFCARCRQQKEAVFQQYNQESVLCLVRQRERQLDLKTRGVREEAAQIQRIREAEYDLQQARKHRRRRLEAAVAAAVILTAGVYFGAVPMLRRWSADRAMTEGRLEQAEEILVSLSSFPGAEERLEKARLAMARRDGAAALEENVRELEPESLAAIAEMLRGENGEDSDDVLADRVEMKLAEVLLIRGNIDGAEELLYSLPEEMEDRDTLLLDCAYARGNSEMTMKHYEAAREIFLQLGDYRDAEKLAQACRYETALGMMEAGNYDEAIAILNEIPDYLDSDELILKNWYLKGFTLENAGETEAARQAYLKAGEYEDAASRARSLRWVQAEALLAAQNYEEALPIYREMDGDGNAREKWILCATEIARAAYKVRDYERAAEILTGLPEDTKDTIRIRTRALFLGAKAVAEQGDLEKAIEMMERVSDYGDASKNLRNWRTELAEEKMKQEKWEEAKQWLEPIADQYNAQKLLKQIEKHLEEAEKEGDSEETEEPETSAEGQQER